MRRATKLCGPGYPGESQWDFKNMPVDAHKTVEPWLLEQVVRADAWDLAVRAVNPFPPTLSRLIHIHACNLSL